MGGLEQVEVSQRSQRSERALRRREIYTSHHETNTIFKSLARSPPPAPLKMQLASLGAEELPRTLQSAAT